jgi:hypothetical protein
MSRRFLAAISASSILLALTYTVLLNPGASASPQELTVVSRTKGHEVLTAEAFDNQVGIKLKNNHKDTITAFVITFSDTTIREDFAYSDVHLGIEPNDAFEKSYPLSPLPVGSQLPTLHLVTVLLKNGTSDGDSKVAQAITDERLGEKIQLHRMVKILEKEGSGKDIKALKGNMTAALDAGEYEVRVIRKEFFPASRMDDNLSEDLKNGLHWALEKMLRKLQTLEQLPTERQEQGLTELKARSQKLLSKL